MAGPITWRNVAPSADANTAAQLLLSSQRSINAALDPLQKMLQDQSAFGAQQAATVREGNKQAFLDALAGAKTPEELAALQASGNLNTLRSRLTPEGLAAVRGADEARLTGLRQQVVAGQQFEDSQVARTNAPVEDAVASLIAEGTENSLRDADGILNSTPQLRSRAKFHSAIAQARQAKVLQERDAAKFTADEAMRPIERARIQAATASSNAAADNAKQNILESNARIKAAEQDRANQKTAAQAQAQSALLAETGNSYVDGIFNPNDTQGLHEMMVKAGIGEDNDARNAIIQRLSKLGGEMELPYITANNKLDHKKIPIPLSMVKQAILGASGGYLWDTDDDWADTAEQNLKDGMKQITEAQFQDGRKYKQNKAVFDYDRYMQSRLLAAENPQVGGKRSK